MWARNVEFMLGCWLALSPFIFRHAPDETFLWVNDLSCAVALGVFSLLSYSPSPRLDKIHLLNAAVGVWLVAAGFAVAAPPPPPAMQNWVAVGLLLLMFGIIPSHATRPPRAWREFYELEARQQT